MEVVKMEVDVTDMIELDDLKKPIELRIVPTKSKLIQEISAKYRKFLVKSETGVKGVSVVLHFTTDGRYELWDILNRIVRIRSAVVIHEDESFDARSYMANYLSNYICAIKSWGACERALQESRWEYPVNCEQLWDNYILPTLAEGPAAIKKAYVKGMKDLVYFRCGKLNGKKERKNIDWILNNLKEGLGLIPESSFFSVAFHIGDWEGVEEGRPLMPETRHELLNTFTGCRIEPIIKNTTLVVAAEFSKRQITDERLIRYEVAERLNLPHYELEESVNYVLNLNRSQLTRKDSEPLGGIVYVSVCHDACEVCTRVYLNTDITPRLFYFDELKSSIANVDKELIEWSPSLPPLHLRCYCRLMRFTGLEH
jgi:hypothetical protein